MLRAHSSRLLLQLRVAKAADALLELADACSFPVATMPNAKGFFPEEHPRFIGTYWGVVSRWTCLGSAHAHGNHQAQHNLRGAARAVTCSGGLALHVLLAASLCLQTTMQHACLGAIRGHPRHSVAAPLSASRLNDEGQWLSHVQPICSRDSGVIGRLPDCGAAVQ